MDTSSLTPRAEGGNRTLNLPLTKRLLYRLSYNSTTKSRVGFEPTIVLLQSTALPLGDPDTFELVGIEPTSVPLQIRKTTPTRE